MYMSILYYYIAMQNKSLKQLINTVQLYRSWMEYNALGWNT